jgi:hypothetical protein
MKRFFRRRHFLIDHRFQLGLALRLFCCLLIVAVLSGWAVYYAVWEVVLVDYHGMHLSRLYHAIGGRLLVYGVGAIVAMSLLSIFFSHRISGPANKMRRIIDDYVKEGSHPGEIHLRRGDTLRGLATSLNELFKHIR